MDRGESSNKVTPVAQPVGDDGERDFGERIEQAARERLAESRMVRRGVAGGRVPAGGCR